MGFWAGIKHDLNSTVGTPQFQSLDKIILGSKGLVASDNFYASVMTSNSFALEKGLSYEIIKMNWAGSIRIKFTASLYSGSASLLTFTVNGVGRGSISVPVQGSGTDFEGYIDITGLKKGDVIGLNVSNNKCTLRSMVVYADVTDMSAFDILF